MALSNERKSAIISDYQREGTDTGSPEVQVALLSAQIDSLAEHFKVHAHDNHSRQGLLKMVNSRRKMLSYLKGRDVNRYSELISRLGLAKVSSERWFLLPFFVSGRHEMHHRLTI